LALLAKAMISTMLASKQGETEVAAELRRAHGLNVSGVPTALARVLRGLQQLG
jgi:predicted DsbA family dithiol-disulfide isomerase